MSDAILQLRGISKYFNGIAVLNNVDFELEKGEIHAIIGKNGSGKSTLVKILSGVYQIDGGNIYCENLKVNLNSPISSLELGITCVQQDPYLFDHFTVAENIFSNDQYIKNKVFRTVDKEFVSKKAQEVLDLMEFPIKATTRVGMLNLGQKRMVEIAKAFCRNSKIIIFDEPTASFSAIETEAFFKVMQNIKRQGVSIIYISQKFEEIRQLADRITVLRDGTVTGCIKANSADYHEMVKMMSGDCLCNRYPKLKVKHGNEIFAVEELQSSNYLNNISFSLAQGEIVGIAGLVGSGKTMLARTIFGLEQKCEGTFFIDRLEASIQCPKDAIDLGIAYVTEDRFLEGVFGNLDVLCNAFSVNKIGQKKLIIEKKVESNLLKKCIRKMNVEIFPNCRQISELSCGNQQKVMLLRWFLSIAKIVIFDEPTKGVDITSKVDIYNIMNDLVRKGAGIILISSDIEELIGMCDRIIVMRKGNIVADLCRNDMNYETIYHYATGN